jgi:DNA-binding protein Fis
MDSVTAERHQPNSVQRLVDLASSIRDEAESLFLERTFAELATRVVRLDASEVIDFYKEVVGFEIDLITLALARSRGSQVRAARLLCLNPTTLNAKIKQYGIVV